MLLGALARKLSRLAGESQETKIGAGASDDPFWNLRSNFSRIRFTHAFPSAQCLTRPVRAPLSLIKANGRLYDAALLERPVLINGRAPEFSIDWKTFGDVQALFGWPGLRKELRVRTAMDRRKRRQADEKLFGYEMISHKDLCWLARVDLSRVPEPHRKAVFDELAALLKSGLLGVGKSKVFVKAGILPKGTLTDICPADRVGRRLGVNGNMVLTLQTPALLLAPTLRENRTGVQLIENQHDPRALMAAYDHVWKALTPALTLKRFFARQFLSGGRYQHGRFRQAKGYQPWLLTEAGSVFIFQVNDLEQAETTVKLWLSNGLPISDPILAAYEIQCQEGSLWERCPFIPQNGYGEIAVNLDIHEEKLPPESSCQEIEPMEAGDEE